MTSSVGWDEAELKVVPILVINDSYSSVLCVRLPSTFAQKQHPNNRNFDTDLEPTGEQELSRQVRVSENITSQQGDCDRGRDSDNLAAFQSDYPVTLCLSVRIRLPERFQQPDFRWPFLLRCKAFKLEGTTDLHRKSQRYLRWCECICPPLTI